MQTPWKYAGADSQIVYRTNDDGRMESCAATRADVIAWVAGGGQIIAADPPAEIVPDLSAQLAALLISNGTIVAADLHPETLASVNAELESAGLTSLSDTEVEIRDA